MCVSPKLVAGSWVGGEYRCIHFRTGALGQGSRTALPVCGYFMQSVMNDPNFSRYHGHFDKPKDSDISYGMYNCSSYVAVKKDTTQTDSTAVIMEDEVFLDENGNIIQGQESQHKASKAEDAKPQSEAEPKNSKPKNHNMSLDDF